MSFNKEKLDLSNNTYKKYILDTVNDLLPSKKKTFFSNEYYLENFQYMLNDLCKWQSLSIIYKNSKQYHWKTIANKFRQWSRFNIFEIAYDKMLADNILSENRSSTTLNLYIDTSDISNLNGSELTGYGQNKKKKQTKVSFICDRNKNVYCMSFYTPNTSDVKTIISSINQIKNKFKYRKINLVGDKGYISLAVKNELKNFNIDLIYPHKKNMTPTPQRSKTHLKKRYLIEHTIKDNKKNNRISLRKDKLIQTFKSFLFLSAIINLDNYIKKQLNNDSIL